MDKNSNKPLTYSFCRSSFIYNTIQNFKGKVLAIDTRDPEFYAKYRLQDSINLNYGRVQESLSQSQNNLELNELTVTDVSKMLNRVEAQRFDNMKRCFCMIIITENSLVSEFFSEVKALAEVNEKADCFTVPEKKFNDTIRALIERIKEEESVSLGFELFRMIQREKVQEVHLLIDGASNFFHSYPFMDPDHYSHVQTLSKNSHPVTKLDKLNELPNDILEGRLFLGNCHHSKKVEILKGFKITHIVNAAYECCNLHEKEGIKYMKLLVRDETEDRFSKYFKQVYDFIHEALSESSSSRVFVHCAMGISRSATIVIMYLMKRFSWSYTMAHDYVKGKRIAIRPYCGFIKELEDLEAKQFEFDHHDHHHHEKVAENF